MSPVHVSDDARLGPEADAVPANVAGMRHDDLKRRLVPGANRLIVELGATAGDEAPAAVEREHDGSNALHRTAARIADEASHRERLAILRVGHRQQLER